MVNWENMSIGLLIFLFSVGIWLSLPEVLELTWIFIFQSAFFALALFGLAIAMAAATGGKDDES